MAPHAERAAESDAAWVPVALVAELLGITRQAIHKRVVKEAWDHRYTTLESGGRRLEIALTALPADLHARAIDRLQPRDVDAGSAGDPPAASSCYDRASAPERAEADRRLLLLDQWRGFLETEGNGARRRAADTARFARTARAGGARVSKSSLYAWDAAYTAQGIDGLLPRYGGGRPSSLPPADRALFLQCWGCEQQPSLATAYRAYLILRQREHAAAPHDPRFQGQACNLNAFRYLIDSLSAEERILLRQGPKAVRAQLLPYIERDWEGCLPLEWFVMDHSPLDILALDEDGRLCRPYLTALMDMGTRRVSVTVCRQPNQNTVLWTLAKAILVWGTPGNLYVDNGKDFRALAVTGGKRKAFRLDLNEGRVTSLCDRLGIQAHFAINYNAQAKPIERWFRTLESQVAVLFESYVGNRPDRKPESLKDSLTAGDVPTFGDVERIVTGWIEGVYHETPHTGRGMAGLSPNAAWAARIGGVEVVLRTRDELRYLLLKDHRPVTVARYQVRLFGRSYQAAPETPDCLYGLHGRKLIPRYDPRDITRVFLTTEDDTAVGWVVEKRLAAIGPAAESVIAAAKREQKKVRAALRTHLADLAASRVEPDRVIRKAREAQERTPAVGALPPAPPPGAPRTATVVALQPKLRAAAALAATPPAAREPADPAATRDALAELIARGDAKTPPAAVQTDDWLDDLIQEGAR